MWERGAGHHRPQPPGSPLSGQCCWLPPAAPSSLPVAQPVLWASLTGHTGLWGQTLEGAAEGRERDGSGLSPTAPLPASRMAAQKGWPPADETPALAG